MRTAILTLILTTTALANPKAQALLDKGDFEKAIEVAQKAVEKDATDVASWLVLADAWVAGGDPHEAWSLVEGALEKNAGSAALHVKMGDVFLAVAKKLAAERGDGTAIRSHYMDADRSYSEALKIDKNSSTALFGRARANYNLSGDKPEYGVKAQEYVGKALMADPKMGKAHAFQAYMFYVAGTNLRRARKENAALEKYRAAIDKYATSTKLDKSDVMDFIRYGHCYLAIGEKTKAKEAYLSGLAAHPDNGIAISGGLKYAFGGKWAQGVDVMKEATTRAPKSMNTWFYYGYTLYANSRFEEALPAFSKAAAITPKDARNHFYAGHCHQKLGKMDKAFGAYRKSLQAAPDYKLAVDQWATNLPRDIDGQEKHFDELRKLAPNTGWFRNNYALILRNWAERRGATKDAPPPDAARRIKKSAQVYEEAAALMPKDPQVQSDTGLLFEFYPVNFDAKKAKMYFTRSLDLSDYTYRDAFSGLNRLCSRTGDWQTLADYADGVLGAMEQGKSPIAPVGGGQPQELPNARAGMMARAKAALARANAKLKKAG